LLSKVEEFVNDLFFSLKSLLSPPQPARLRTFFGAAFGSFKKYAPHFLNSAFGGTEPNEAPPKVLVRTRAEIPWKMSQFWYEFNQYLC
jgi:hypothetical protein